MSNGTSAFLKCYNCVCCYFKYYLPKHVRPIRKPDTCLWIKRSLTDYRSYVRSEKTANRPTIKHFDDTLKTHPNIRPQGLKKKTEDNNIQIILLDTGATFPRQIRKLAVREGENSFKLHKCQKIASGVARQHFRMHTIGLHMQV